jgi:hypothetical protein
MNLLDSMLEMLATQVGGYYDPASDSFSLMDQCPRGVAGIILAHELDHALDDQLFGIDDDMLERASLTDATVAYGAVVEGSGTNVMYQWLMKHLDQADMGAYAAMEEAGRESLANAPMWFWKPMMFVYMRGASFLTRSTSMMAGVQNPADNADIATAFKDPPRSTEQVLHPEKYWEADKVEEPRQLGFEAERLPEGWEILREDVMGEVALSILTTAGAATEGLDLSNPANALTMKFTNAPADGWGGDRLVLLGRGDARFLRLVSVWDSERDAGEFFGGMSVVLPGIEDAARELNGETKGKWGARLEYGEASDEVVLTTYHGVDRKDLKKVENALTHSEGKD